MSAAPQTGAALAAVEHALARGLPVDDVLLLADDAIERGEATGDTESLRRLAALLEGAAQTRADGRGLSVAARRAHAAAAVTARATRQVPPGRLLGWAILVGVLALLSYAANLAAGKPPDDVLYRWSTAVGGVIQYALILAVVLLLARGLPREALGLRRPPSWRAAAGWIFGALVAIWVIGAILNIFLKAGEEQGLVPSGWDSGRAAPFVANFVVVALVAPLVEELTYRGLGYTAVRDVLGDGGAILVTAVAFGLAHGLVVALPVLTIFGAILATLRLKTRSVYPSIILHAVFNGAALLAAVST